MRTEKKGEKKLERKTRSKTLTDLIIFPFSIKEIN